LRVLSTLTIELSQIPVLGRLAASVHLPILHLER
jgi:hypothetical protein